MQKQKKKKKKIFKRVFKLAIIICIVIVCYTMGLTVEKIKEETHSLMENEKVQEAVSDVSTEVDNIKENATTFDKENVPFPDTIYGDHRSEVKDDISSLWKSIKNFFSDVAADLRRLE